jgi:NAD(P)H-flavin reductase
MGFVFGVRTVADVFYQDEIHAAGTRFSEFVSQKYLSQAELPGFKKGYVTDFLTPENIAAFEEFYLCGSPAMVKDARQKLEKLGISKERVFFEQY